LLSEKARTFAGNRLIIRAEFPFSERGILVADLKILALFSLYEAVDF